MEKKRNKNVITYCTRLDIIVLNTSYRPTHKYSAIDFVLFIKEETHYSLTFYLVRCDGSGNVNDGEEEEEEDDDDEDDDDGDDDDDDDEIYDENRDKDGLFVVVGGGDVSVLVMIM